MYFHDETFFQTSLKSRLPKKIAFLFKIQNTPIFCKQFNLFISGGRKTSWTTNGMNEETTLCRILNFGKKSKFWWNLSFLQEKYEILIFVILLLSINLVLFHLFSAILPQTELFGLWKYYRPRPPIPGPYRFKSNIAYIRSMLKLILIAVSQSMQEITWFKYMLRARTVTQLKLIYDRNVPLWTVPNIISNSSDYISESWKWWSLEFVANWIDASKHFETIYQMRLVHLNI